MLKFILCATLITFTFGAACDPRRNTVPPETAAQKFADDLGLKLSGKPNCTEIDTDNDGYVTCTLAVIDRPEAPSRILSLQCAGVTGTGCSAQTEKLATGCKQTELKIVAPAPTTGS